MNRIILGASILAVVLAATVVLLWSGHLRNGSTPAAPARESPALAVQAPKKYVFDIILHEADAIDRLLSRAEKLARERPVPADTGIALVLHGPEVEFFRQKNYARYRAIVDRARRLDRAGIIEVKICRTRMRAHGIQDHEVPDFVEVVPFGPAEVERLKKLGYVSL